MAIHEVTSFEAFCEMAEEMEATVFVRFGSSLDPNQVRFAFAISRDDEIVGHFSRADGPISIQDAVIASDREEYLSYQG